MGTSAPVPGVPGRNSGICRGKMPSITIRFVATTGFVAWAIRRVTWGVVNHVELVLDDGRVLGAYTGEGISVHPYWEANKEYRYSIPCSQSQHDAIMAYAYSQLGKPYDFLDILGFLFHRDWRRENRWTCAEFVTACFEIGGMPLLNAPLNVVNRISPRDLFLSPMLLGNEITD
jgi:uncharacterized protein YycO